MAETINYFSTLPLWELVAVIASLAYVIFAAKGSLWCWPAAILSTVIYTIIFYDVYLWSDSALQIYYFVMAIYGWYSWQQNKNEQNANDQQEKSVKIIKKTTRFHVYAIACMVVLSLILGFLMATYTPTDFPYLDAATTVFALFATYLVTQRVLENWLYWVVIDAVSIYLYQAKALTPTAGLFVLYVFLALYAYWQWWKKFNQQSLKSLHQ